MTSPKYNNIYIYQLCCRVFNFNASSAFLRVVNREYQFLRVTMEIGNRRTRAPVS